MADITMCNGKGCPVKTRCWRTLAFPSDMQSYSDFDDLRGDASRCEYFWDMGIVGALTDSYE